MEPESAKSYGKDSNVDSDDNSPPDDIIVIDPNTEESVQKCEMCQKPDAAYQPPRSGCRYISLHDQPRPVRALMDRAIREVVGDAIFNNAFPGSTGVGWASLHYSDVIMKSAAELKLNALIHRIKHDIVFVDHVSRVVSLQFALPFRVTW